MLVHRPSLPKHLRPLLPGIIMDRSEASPPLDSPTPSSCPRNEVAHPRAMHDPIFSCPATGLSSSLGMTWAPRKKAPRLRQETPTRHRALSPLSGSPTTRTRAASGRRSRRTSHSLILDSSSEVEMPSELFARGRRGRPAQVIWASLLINGPCLEATRRITMTTKRSITMATMDLCRN